MQERGNKRNKSHKPAYLFDKIIVFILLILRDIDNLDNFGLYHRAVKNKNKRGYSCADNGRGMSR